ncbi:MAG: hypothetical protein RR365_02105 [Bacteroides sp.]
MQRHIADIRHDIETNPARSAWDKGVRGYAEELFDGYVRDALNICDENTCLGKIAEKDLLNGASDWSQYSWGGCADVYDCDICEHLCSPSEQKKRRGGELRPNANEEWLDVQARALRQAARLVIRAVNRRD